MIDYFALALTHGLLVIAFWRLLQRSDLDSEQDGEMAGDSAPPAPQPSAASAQDRFKLPPKGMPRA